MLAVYDTFYIDKNLSGGNIVFKDISFVELSDIYSNKKGN